MKTARIQRVQSVETRKARALITWLNLCFELSPHDNFCPHLYWITFSAQKLFFGQASTYSLSMFPFNSIGKITNKSNSCSISVICQLLFSDGIVLKGGRGNAHRIITFLFHPAECVNGYVVVACFISCNIYDNSSKSLSARISFNIFWNFNAKLLKSAPAPTQQKKTIQNDWATVWGSGQLGTKSNSVLSLDTEKAFWPKCS